MAKFIGPTDLTYLWTKIKNYIANSSPVTSVNNQTGDVTLIIPDVSGKEITSNKVTSLSSSSTDTQYPSAKCVWDLVGDIETLLAAI